MAQDMRFRTGKGGLLIKILAIFATVLVWFSVAALVTEGVFRFDYLAPAELFPLALGAGALLVWMALRVGLRLKLIGWGFGIALALLIGGQSVAVFTGMASGETEPTGWLAALAIGAIVGYSLALVVVGVGGILLVMDLFKRQ